MHAPYNTEYLTSISKGQQSQYVTGSILVEDRGIHTSTPAEAFYQEWDYKWQLFSPLYFAIFAHIALDNYACITFRIKQNNSLFILKPSGSTGTTALMKSTILHTFRKAKYNTWYVHAKSEKPKNLCLEWNWKNKQQQQKKPGKTHTNWKQVATMMRGSYFCLFWLYFFTLFGHVTEQQKTNTHASCWINATCILYTVEHSKVVRNICPESFAT